MSNQPSVEIVDRKMKQLTTLNLNICFRSSLLFFFFFKHIHLPMSGEIDEYDEVQDEPSTIPPTEDVPLDDQDENDQSPLATPNGRQTPSTTSYSDVVIEKPVTTTDDASPHPLLEVIHEKSNKEASSAILNTVS